MMERRMKEVEEKDRVSKTLLITNVLCVEDDFMLKSPPFSESVHYSHHLPLIPNGFHHKRCIEKNVKSIERSILDIHQEKIFAFLHL